MPIDPWTMLAAGGRPAIGLLEYCVISTQLEIVVAWLIEDYRNRPTAERAIALYDAFLARQAPARIRAPAVLPPHGSLLAAQIDRVRRQLEDVTVHNAQHPDDRRPPAIPPRSVFDDVSTALRAPDFEPVLTIRETYDPAREPAGNLPGGRMNAGQRAFLENTWRAQIRPALVHAGFARVATVGG